jgi:hypothetical protein
VRGALGERAFDEWAARSYALPTTARDIVRQRASRRTSTSCRAPWVPDGIKSTRRGEAYLRLLLLLAWLRMIGGSSPSRHLPCFRNPQATFSGATSERKVTLGWLQGARGWLPPGRVVPGPMPPNGSVAAPSRDGPTQHQAPLPTDANIAIGWRSGPHGDRRYPDASCFVNVSLEGGSFSWLYSNF